MSQAASERVRWTVDDLELLPDNGTHYEIIDGELLMTTQPHARHQEVCTNIAYELTQWSRASGLGRVFFSPGVVFDKLNSVAPDLVWISKERAADALDAAGHFTTAPELVIEVLSPGSNNERRDREIKRKLYSMYGVQEYWVVRWQSPQIEVYRRSQTVLHLELTWFANDTATSPLLPGFASPVSTFFMA